MDQTAKRYLTRLRRALVCPKRDRERLLADAREMLDNFAQENPGAFYQDYVASFGQPQDFAREMLAGLDPEDVTEAKLRRRRALMGAGAAVAAVAVLLAGIWFGRQSRPAADTPAPTAEQTASVTGDPESGVSPDDDEVSGTASIAANAIRYTLEQFTDSGDIVHREAVGVLVKLGVMVDKEDGSHFRPHGAVTRAEAAKLIYLLMHGGKDLSDDDLAIKDEPSFPDIQGHWAEAYIEYCADLNIALAQEDGNFDPDEALSGMELIRMALTALGYDPLAYGFLLPKWPDRVDEIARITAPSLYTDLLGVRPNDPVTRDNAAQILYNALRNKTKVVTPAAVTADTMEPVLEYTISDYTLLYVRFGFDLADITFD